MPGGPKNFTVTVERTDGGDSIEDRDVQDLFLRSGLLTIFDGGRPIFHGREWRWLEVRRIDETAKLVRPSKVRMEQRPLGAQDLAPRQPVAPRGARRRRPGPG